MPHTESENEKPVEHQIQPDREETDRHRGPLPVDRIKGRRENLDAGVADQTDRIELEGLSRMQGIGIEEFPPLVDQGDDRLSQDDQPDC